MHDFDAHLALHQSETFVSSTETNWLRFEKEVADGLGLLHLDGDQDKDGYSIDMAHDLFEDGCDVENAISEFRHYIAESARREKNEARAREFEIECLEEGCE